jgi:hypothetical protein
MNNIWLKPYRRVAFLSVTEITGAHSGSQLWLRYEPLDLRRVCD